MLERVRTAGLVRGRSALASSLMMPKGVSWV
jgi:hypothetical protein